MQQTQVVFNFVFFEVATKRHDFSSKIYKNKIRESCVPVKSNTNQFHTKNYEQYLTSESVKVLNLPKINIWQSRVNFLM